MSAPDPSLARRIANRKVAPGSLGAWWLGGSGFIFKTPAGRQIWIDPYLSDAVQTMFGVARAFPAPITAEEAEPDIVISTHWHEDHLDPGCIPELARRRPGAKFVMPPTAMAHALSWGLAPAQVVPFVQGQVLELGEVKLTAIVARHEAGIAGWEVPDALGVVFDFGGLRLFHTGDTDYDARIHRALKGTSFAFATLCMNGSVGNMNAHEAALLAWQLDACTLMPHHHYLWSRPKEKIPVCETLDPKLFEETYRKLGGAAAVIIPELARDMTITADGLTVS